MSEIFLGEIIWYVAAFFWNLATLRDTKFICVETVLKPFFSWQIWTKFNQSRILELKKSALGQFHQHFTRIFICTKVLCEAFLFLHFRFARIGRKIIGAKAAHEMLEK